MDRMLPFEKKSRSSARHSEKRMALQPCWRCRAAAFQPVSTINRDRYESCTCWFHLPSSPFSLFLAFPTPCLTFCHLYPPFFLLLVSVPLPPLPLPRFHPSSFIPFSLKLSPLLSGYLHFHEGMNLTRALSCFRLVCSLSRSNSVK